MIKRIWRAVKSIFQPTLADKPGATDTSPRFNFEAGRMGQALSAAKSMIAKQQPPGNRRQRRRQRRGLHRSTFTKSPAAVVKEFAAATSPDEARELVAYLRNRDRERAVGFLKAKRMKRWRELAG